MLLKQRGDRARPDVVKAKPDMPKLENGLGYEQTLERIGFSASLTARIASEAKAIAPDLMLCSDEPGYDHLLAHLLAVKTTLAEPDRATPTPSFIDQSFDFLWTNCWEIGFLKALCFAANTHIPEKGFLAAIVTVRNEGPFIVEWIAHHLAVGINNFFVYTNDNTDGSLDLLRALADAKIISLIENDAASDTNPQVKAYDHSLYLNLEARAFRWLAYLDADELTIPPCRFDFRIEGLIREVTRDTDPSSLSLNWMWMGSGGNVRKDLARGMSERFLIGRPFSLFVKSVVRPSAVLSMRSVHKPVLRSGRFGVNSGGRPIDMNEHSSPFCFEGGEIRHYWNKSFEEFLVKQARGVDRAVWERETEKFFEWDATLENGGTIMPLPEDLKRRASSHAAAIRALPNVLEAEKVVKERYSVLALAACNNVSIDRHYALARNRMDLRAILRANTEARPTQIDIIGKMEKLKKA